MSFLSKLWKGATEPFTGSKARKQAQAAYRAQETAAAEQTRIQQENYRKSLEQNETWFKKQMEADQRVHNDNMTAQRQALQQNREQFERQFRQAQQGLYLQQQAMQQAQAEAQRQFNNQQAQMERQINANNTERQTFHKKEEGVAGTILTGPGGIDQDELERKKKKHTLLGGA